MRDDHAILVGIARYQDAEHYPPLEGPLNDVESVFEWLRSPGYELPEANIQKLTTDTRMMSPEKGMVPLWKPSSRHFADAFDTVAYDQAGNFRRHNGRLYMYFSGHGFSLMSDKTTRAALFAADCMGNRHRNLPGSLYAEVAKRFGLFREIVLIMDCCRDLVSEFEYALPEFGNGEDDDSEAVKVLAVYAAPRRGRAQERKLLEADGKMVGLVTHAWLRALREVQCDILGSVAASQLKQHILNNWEDWYLELAPPPPRFVLPEEEDLLFQSGRMLKAQSFRLADRILPGSRLMLRSEHLHVLGKVDENGIKWDDQVLLRACRSEWDATQAPSRQVELYLPAEAFTLTVEGSTLPFLPGDHHVIDI